MLEVIVAWGDGAQRSVTAAAFLRRAEGFTIGEAEGCDAKLAPGRGSSGHRVVVRRRGGRLDLCVGAFVVRTRFVAEPAVPVRLVLRTRIDATWVAAQAASLLLHAATLSLLLWRSLAPLPASEDNDAAAVRARLLKAIDESPSLFEPLRPLDADRHASSVAAPETTPRAPSRAQEAATPAPGTPQAPEKVPPTLADPGKVPIGHDAPDMLEQIQRQIASWGPAPLPNHGRASVVASWTPNDFLRGRLSARLIAGVVRFHNARFRECYAASPSSYGQTGEVRVAFVVSPQGQVVGAHDAGGSFPNDAVRACVVAAMAKIPFPAPPSGTPQSVTYAVALPANEAPAGSP
jgi:hypothetical protein